MGKVTGYSYIPQPFGIDPVNKKLIEIYRPMIAIRISKDHGTISLPFDALLDSGSDRNLFPLGFATSIGLQFKKTKPKQIIGIGKVIIDAYSSSINIWIGTTKYQTEVDFSPQQQTPLLGRNGFFNLFKSVKFDEQGQFVYIEE
ncbi:MAG: hypothetical protein ACD_38C00104G0012 [uncultured bacterium]|uniref:Peptidase A2 domain-containing protein n=1 Tax=Candidatus Daviesbacteria bacterium GW2011_GWC2_40_12 TaxID=1618431 RepID=A0A0G0QN09_9BACT|nr:MAG: hypothetical protein ACD_38C00104G0012 [uncultured bacterium]KKR16539.1 MAG: hypothetical protein UT45_C0005G0068 [Candidatus Daviesbacteria bacterium GW2011_GWA2_39_33]KKR23554.1 MAG: hypothetical protein UT54_C0044G0006 [Candidatus Daviesbacteria bacterium GW2011_GWB1_39_5]KKR41804.1 MAG: hypothetical protein UT77_C0006G0036 [Candidatus Daviesbacteria bacterium GW2011_GWC2_40_12]OGE21117.1 MAG: hypothetical protein A2778_02715 [Candidatus Daviesbacteria bacterium RIFCSPHIGHO2_01_FULL_